MKKTVFSLVLSTLSIFLLLSQISSYAIGETVIVDEIKLEAIFPEGWDIITRDIAKSVAVLEKYDLESSEVLNLMKTGNRYVEAINPFTNNEITICYSSDQSSEDIGDLSNFSDSDMKNVIERSKTDNSLPEDVAVSWFESANYKYFYYVHGGSQPYLYQYRTVKNGKFYDVHLLKYGNALMDSEKEDLKYVVNNLSIKSEITTTPTNTYQYESVLQRALNGALVAIVFGMFFGVINYFKNRGNK